MSAAVAAIRSALERDRTQPLRRTPCSPVTTGSVPDTDSVSVAKPGQVPNVGAAIPVLCVQGP